MTKQNKTIRIIFIISICFLLALSVFTYSRLSSLIQSGQIVNHTTQVKLELEKVIGSLKDAETGQRDYLLTHDKTFLEPFIKGLKEYPQNIKNVKQLIIDNPDQQKSLSTVEQLAQNREGYMRKLLEVDKLRRPTNTELLIGKSIMDSIRTEINSMIAREDSFLQHRTNQLHTQTTIAPVMLLILCLMALAIVTISYWHLNKSLLQSQLLKVEAIQQAVQFEKTKEIQDSEKRYNMMLMKSPFCFGVIKGKDMTITLANAAIKEVWGKGNDLEGKPFLEILPELINTNFPSLIQNVMTTGLPYYGYEMLAQLNKNGKLEDCYFNFVYQPYYESEQTISGVTIIAIEVTKEVKVKKQLEKSEMRFRNMVEQAPVAISILRGENFTVEVANEKQLELFGKTKDQVLNLPLFTAVPESEGQGFEELLNGVYTTGKPFFANEIPSVLTRNGKKDTFYSNFISKPLYNDEHKIDGIVSIAIDVTEQVVARKKIEESETLHRQIFEFSPVAIWEKDDTALYQEIELLKQKGIKDFRQYLDTNPEEIFRLVSLIKLENVNNESVDLLQAAGKEEVLTSFHKLFTAESIPMLTEGIMGVVENKKRLTVASVLQSLKGKRLEILFSFDFRIGNDMNKSLVSLTDITEQVDAGKIIEQSEAQFNTLANNIQNLAWMADGEGYIYWYNQRWYDYTGTTLEEMKGQGWEKVHHPDHVTRVVDFVKKAWKINEPFELTFPLRSANGEYRWFLTRAFPVCDVEGKISNWIGTNTDITEQKNFAERLEIKVADRTAELNGKNEELENMNKELQSFAYISSHDLQEPLRKIQTFSNRILETEEHNLSNNGKDMFNRMQAAAKRMQTLIQDLLAYSRTSTEERKFENTDLNKIVEEVRDDLKEELKEKHATIEATALCEAHIIPFQFRQLLHNLIGNSLKFSNPNNPPYIKIKSEIAKGIKFNNDKLLPEIKYCRITFSDNGIGFEQQYKEKIFEVFQRLHGKQEYSGTGIGLAIVKKIVENHHGVITAGGELNKGAIFEIYIPAT